MRLQINVSNNRPVRHKGNFKIVLNYLKRVTRRPQSLLAGLLRKNRLSVRL
jgi:hypothetical protein